MDGSPPQKNSTIIIHTCSLWHANALMNLLQLKPKALKGIKGMYIHDCFQQENESYFVQLVRQSVENMIFIPDTHTHTHTHTQRERERRTHAHTHARTHTHTQTDGQGLFNL